MMEKLGRVLLKITLWTGVLLTFFILLELTRAFVFFYRLNHLLGFGFLAVTAGIFCLLIASTLRAWFAQPRALQPPSIPPLEESSFHDLRRYTRYLRAYLDRLAANPNLDPVHRRKCVETSADLKSVLHAHPLRADMIEAVTSAEHETIIPALENLGQRAREEIRRSVRDVMLGVTLSPFHAVDILIVLYRAGAMILRISRIYVARPARREQWLIVRDTLRLVAAVNILNVGRTLVEKLFSSIPVLGALSDEIAQGLGAGLFTSAAGHAAMERCAAFRGWNPVSAGRTLAGDAARFCGDVRRIFSEDILPIITRRLPAPVAGDAISSTADNILGGVRSAMDAAAAALATCVLQPAAAGAHVAVRAGGHARRSVARLGGGTLKIVQTPLRNAFLETRRLWRLSLQRLRYRSHPRQAPSSRRKPSPRKSS